MSSFGSTLTGGIQDISALLPLLGTEQCEDHVGSALLGGYLYAAVAPLSIFGSLGIVRAGAKALAASCSLEVRGRKIMGAEKVNDAGFSQAGKVLSLIMWDGNCHLAEKQFTMTLDKLHITNVASLTIHADTWAWNLKMLGVSLIAVIASLTPYLYLFKVGDQPFSVRWLLPLARSVGSLAISNLIQIIIQQRLLEITKHRIVFMTMDDLIRTTDASLLRNRWWNTRVSSEVALYNLEQYLEQNEVRQEGGTLQEELQTAMTDHSLPMAKLRRSMLVIARVVILFGLGFSVIGYIGSFSLVQSATPIHALIWLVLEIVLSLMRIFLWSWNPKGDEDALTISLKLGRICPLPTCDKFSEELEEESIIPLTRSSEFLGEITSVFGLLKPIQGIEEGIVLYYTMTVSEKSGERVLYITTLDYKERSSHTFKLDSYSHGMVCRTANIEVESDMGGISRVQAKMGKEVDMGDNHLTREPPFVQGLMNHGFTILDKLNGLSYDGPFFIRESLSMKLTWELEQMAADNEDLDYTTVSRQLERTWIMNITMPSGSAVDMAYLQAGKLERARRYFCLERRQWVNEYYSLIIGETLAELVAGPQAP